MSWVLSLWVLTVSSGFGVLGATAAPAEEERGDDHVFLDSAETLAPKFGLKPRESTRIDGATGKKIPITEYVNPKDDAAMVFVPGGPFLMGSDYSAIFDDPIVVNAFRAARVTADYFNNEQPKHEVTVSSFFIDRHEVSNKQYAVFLEWFKENGRTEGINHPDEPINFDHTPWEWKNGSFFDDDRPVVGINWFSAYAYARWAGKRLPTEAEWEKAARGTDGRKYPWGEIFDPRLSNVHDSNNMRTLPIDACESGQSPYGCYNMSGNVWELTLDWMNGELYIERKDFTDPLWDPVSPDKVTKVIRGGSWNPKSGIHLGRTTARAIVNPYPLYRFDEFTDARDYLQFGIRCVMSPKEQVPQNLDKITWARALRFGEGMIHRDGMTTIPMRDE